MITKYYKCEYFLFLTSVPVCTTQNPQKSLVKKNILLVGKTGKGKSRITEILCNKTGLSSNTRTNSYTNQIHCYSLPNNEFTIIDTPGFGDSEGRDNIFIGQLYQLLKYLEDGLVLIVYVKSELDHLDHNEKTKY